MVKWTFIGIPLVLMLSVAFISATTFANNCQYRISDNCQDMTSGMGVFSNPLTWLYTGLPSVTAQQVISIGIAAGGIILIVFAILGSLQVLGSGFQFNSEQTRMLITIGAGILIYGWISVYSVELFSIPWGIGNILWAVLMVLYAFGLFDLARSSF
jgi:hypothetical protein